MPRSILLLSGSRVHGSGYLESYETILSTFTKGIEKMLFVPYAVDESAWSSYTTLVREKFKSWNVEIIGIHEPGILNTLKEFNAIFIGGGNTFRMLNSMQKLGLIDPIREAVLNNDMRYLGSSAGSNMACPTIRTTNDMPIIYPEKGFDALNLVSFQVNPHFIDADPTSKHMGETREDRLKEFHEINTAPVVGLREGAFLHMEENYFTSGILTLGGTNGAKLFFQGKREIDIQYPATMIIQQDGVRIMSS